MRTQLFAQWRLRSIRSAFFGMVTAFALRSHATTELLECCVTTTNEKSPLSIWTTGLLYLVSLRLMGRQVRLVLTKVRRLESGGRGQYRRHPEFDQCE